MMVLPSLTTYPAETGAAVSSAFNTSQRGSLRKAAATDSAGKDYPTVVKPSLYPIAEGQPARAPWWSASGDVTSPGHPMVVSQWSNPEQQPTQLAVRLRIQVEPGAVVRTVLLVPRKEASEWQQHYSNPTLIRSAALHCHGPFQSGFSNGTRRRACQHAFLIFGLPRRLLSRS